MALAALTLPLTPSWAQKPEEHSQEIVTIVKSDQDSEGKPDEVTNTDIELVLTTDGNVDKIKADSLDKAIDEIKVLIKKTIRKTRTRKEPPRVKGLNKHLKISKRQGQFHRVQGQAMATPKRKKGGHHPQDRGCQAKQAHGREEGQDREGSNARRSLRKEMISAQKKLRDAEMDFIKTRGDVHGPLEIHARRPHANRAGPGPRRARARMRYPCAERQKKQAAEHAAVAEQHQKQAAEHAEVAERQKKQAAEHALRRKRLRLRLDTDRAALSAERA